ncbi:tetraacyldisaccharide 4'-kinase [Undibacterium arcticum]|uniref:Tetraacyldisaccharide 4'-kinase n=1 Tax=Undibacterium arcticum TaxID=1762892 RepID=A0ABV7EWA3_9BURK
MADPRPTLEATLTEHWNRRGWLARLLWPLSLLFAAIVALRRALYARGVLTSSRLPVPVVVVGNVFVGGTGKTPLTIWLVDALRRHGYTPGVISRGYGVENALPQPVMADSAPQQVGDEPVLIATRANCPVMVGRDRVAAGRALLAAQPQVDIIVSDDGLQHYALQRDVEIVLSDARGDGNGWLLPAGPLREPAGRGRDFTVLNGGPAASGAVAAAGGPMFTMQLAGTSAERLSDPTQRVALAELAQLGRAGATILAAAGIGNPARFFTMLRAAGLDFAPLPLPDHYDFSRNPFTGLRAEIILITEKDAVKCRQIDTLNNDPRLWVVPVAAQIDPALAEKIVEKCRGRKTA